MERLALHFQPAHRRLRGAGGRRRGKNPHSMISQSPCAARLFDGDAIEDIRSRLLRLVEIDVEKLRLPGHAQVSPREVLFQRLEHRLVALDTSARHASRQMNVDQKSRLLVEAGGTLWSCRGQREIDVNGGEELRLPAGDVRWRRSLMIQGLIARERKTELSLS